MKHDMYATPSKGAIFSPFSLHIDPMEHLMLVNFEKDPDEFYHTLEFQQARDANGRKYLLAIAYRIDGASDIYYQPGFPFASQESILNNTSFFVRTLGNAKFEVEDDSLEVYFAFEDKSGREIEVKVRERKRKNKKPFFLLAPVGANTINPTSLPVYSLYEMSFAKQKWTDIEISIDNVKHKPDTFPIPVDCAKNYFTRYAVDTFNVDWNKNFNGPLSPLTPDNDGTFEDKGITYETAEQNGHIEIKRISTENGEHTLTIDFSPAIPDLVCLKQDMDINGIFSISTDHTAGTISGNYLIGRHANDIDFQIQPSDGWNPHESRWILKILFFLVKIFREWPKSYVWHAHIKLDDTDRPTMQSGWERISSSKSKTSHP